MGLLYHCRNHYNSIHHRQQQQFQRYNKNIYRHTPFFSSASSAVEPKRRFQILRRLGNTVKTSLAVVGLLTVGYCFSEYSKLKNTSSIDGDEDKKKQRVLVIPFHRLNVVEKKKQSLFGSSSSLSSIVSGGADDLDEEEKRIEIGIQELVDIIHEAASDPTIVGLYGIFGHGFEFKYGGYAHIEEIRNALKVFKESHRYHLEPNIPKNNEEKDEKSNHTTCPRKKPKAMYAYADSFANYTSGNVEYYLASIFDTIHMQEQGELNLFGLTSLNVFLRDTLYKYGIKVNVFKHGLYKNAPNTFTESNYTNEHIENILNVLYPINEYMCENITNSRTNDHQQQNANRTTNFPKLDHWKLIHNSRTFTSTIAKKYDFIDYITLIDPLYQLVENNNKNSKGNHDDNSNHSMTAFLSNKIFGTKNNKSTDNANESTTAATTTTTPLSGTSSVASSSTLEQNTKTDKDSTINTKKMDSGSNKNTLKKNSIGDHERVTSSSKIINTTGAASAKKNIEQVEQSKTNENSSPINTNFDHFLANETISLSKYYKQVVSKKEKEKKMWHLYSWMKEKCEGNDDNNGTKHPMFQKIINLCGYNAPYYNIPKSDFSHDKAKALNESIALLHIQGTISAKTARTITNSLRKIKKDKSIKGVIVRVDSSGGSPYAAEMILQECNDIPQEVVFSFGNISASAGYYIATNADRIFASPTTITGSIGVFGLKFDFSNFFASQYGMKIRHISTSQLAASGSLFQPMTKKIKMNTQEIVDRMYMEFKKIVSVNRNLPLQYVESIAQGKVYVGNHAKNNGLVDEIGGLHRAIYYAQRKYCNGNYHTPVKVWPECQYTFKTKLQRLVSQMEADSGQIISPAFVKALKILSILCGEYTGGINELEESSQSTQTGISTMPLPMNSIFNNSNHQPFLNLPTLLPEDAYSGVAMTVDENAAIEYLFSNLKRKEQS